MWMLSLSASITVSASASHDISPAVFDSIAAAMSKTSWSTVLTVKEPVEGVVAPTGASSRLVTDTVMVSDGSVSYTHLTLPTKRIV